jgi:hypothetical protein
MRIMIRLRHLGAGIVVALCATTVGLSGQQSAQQEVSVAPEPGWTFIPGVIVGATYDSNVIVTTSVGENGRPPSDTYYTIDPTGSLRFKGKRTGFAANYRGNFRRYASIDELDGYDQHANVSIDRRATKRLTLFANNQYSTSPTTDEVDLTGVPFRRAGSRYDTLAAGMAYRLTEHTDWTARYDFTYGAFDRKSADLSGGMIHAFQTGVMQRLTSRLKVGADGSYRFADMDVTGLLVGEGHTLQFYEVGSTISYDLGQFTTVSAGGGWSHVNDELRALSRTGPYVRGSISHSEAQTVFGASYERSFVPSFGFGGSTRSQRVAGWIDLPPIGRRIYVQGAGSWRRTNPFDNLQALRLDTITFRTTAGYAIARQIRLQGVYVFSRQDSAVTGGEVNRNRAGVELVLFNPMRIQ